jgi:N,N'-diacetyllegionaminate synthase
MRGENLLLLIPARGGSKGFPGKNLAEIGGIPLVGWAARTAHHAANTLGSGCRVVCSTDDAEIAAAARLWGAEIPFTRPPKLASDGAATIDVLLHALDTLDAQFDGVVVLQPTSPLTHLQDVIGAVTLFRETGAPVISVCPAEHPAEWLFRLDDAGRLSPVLSRDGLPAQRQQAGNALRVNGAIYVSDVVAIRNNRSFFTPETRAFLMPVARSVDIDAPLDLEFARSIVHGQDIRPVAIGDRLVGPGHPCFVIAEAGVNHNGDLNLARRLVDAAVAAGADAIKFQTFSAERLVTRAAPKAEYQIRTTDAHESQFEMLERLELDAEAHLDLVRYCRGRGILFLSTPFDEESCDLLDSLGVPAFKIGSGDLTNVFLLRDAADRGKPLIVSTGMATLNEVARAVDAVRQQGCHDLVLLHCVSNYPADPADANLRAITTLREAFGVPVGFSDHTDGDTVALAAVALGACVVEKHLTLDRQLAGPDHQASVEQGELTAMIRRIRSVEAALGDGRKAPRTSETSVSAVARRSLVAARFIAAGTILERDMMAVRRPGTGLGPEQLNSLVGKRALRDVPEGALLEWEMVS